jgi:hypothetical protein
MLIESWYDFLLGVLSTLIIVLIFNFLTKTYRRYTKDIEEANQPQTIIHRTPKTPKEIVDAADAARFKRTLLFGVIFILWLAFLYNLFPASFDPIVTLFGL